MSKFKDAAQQDGVTIREGPFDTSGSIGVVERYQAPLRRTYLTLHETSYNTFSNDGFLRMATYSRVTAVNSIIWRELNFPMLLCTLTSPGQITPASTQREREKAIEKAKVEVTKKHALQKL